jgi:ribosome-associated protein
MTARRAPSKRPSPSAPSKRPSPSKALPRPPRKARTGPAAPTVERSRDSALVAARAALEKKAQAVQIVDVTGKVDYADYLVLMTGTSDRHVKAIADAVDEELSKAGNRAVAVEGLPTASWVVLDFVDVVVHVFQREARSVYDLDGLWMDAGRVPVLEDEPSEG